MAHSQFWTRFVDSQGWWSDFHFQKGLCLIIVNLKKKKKKRSELLVKRRLKSSNEFKVKFPLSTEFGLLWIVMEIIIEFEIFRSRNN